MLDEREALGYTWIIDLLDRVGWSVGYVVEMMGCVWSVEGIELVVLMGVSSVGHV